MKYDFKCDACGIFTVEHSIKEQHPATCPTCGGKIRQVYFPVGVVYKATGFSADSRKYTEGGDPIVATKR